MTLPGKYSKNKKPRILPLEGTLREIIERRIGKRDITCPYVFHRSGKPIKSFRKAFQAAAIAAGLGKMIEDEQRPGKKKYDGIVPHDMRRSAIRNFRKAGVSESDGMKLSGHKTRSVYDRYNIIDDEDSRQAMKQAQQYLRQEAGRKVIPLRRKAQ